jgi:aryl-alcohol dehydrogenase-like predicted oxidoreductase
MYRIYSIISSVICKLNSNRQDANKNEKRPGGGFRAGSVVQLKKFCCPSFAKGMPATAWPTSRIQNITGIRWYSKLQKNRRDSMEYGTVNGLDRKVSRIIFGTGTLTDQEDLREDFTTLDVALEQGINTFDTSKIYGGGTAEIALGKYFRDRKNRSGIILISKGCYPAPWRRRVTPYDLSSDLHDSLARIGTDYIDLYLLHRDDPSQPVGPLIETLDRYCRDGKIRAYGASNWNVTRIAEANRFAAENGLRPLIVSSPNYSLAELYRSPWAPGSVTISGAENAEQRAWYAREKMPVFAYTSLAHGLFSGRINRALFDRSPESIDPMCAKAFCGDSNFTRLERATVLAEEKGVPIAQVALAYILNGEMDVYPVIGASNKTEILSSTGSLNVMLSRKEKAWLNLETDER